MKKVIFFIGTCLMGSQFSIAQSTCFGLKGGLLSAHARVRENKGSASTSDSGFYLGAFSKFHISEKVIIVPGIDYGNINGNESAYFSLMGGYYVSNRFNIQIGPQISYLLETTPNEVDKIGLDLGFGIAYDIDVNFSISVRYNSELSNRASTVDADYIRTRFDWLFIGMGYSF